MAPRKLCKKKNIHFRVGLGQEYENEEKSKVYRRKDYV